MDIKDELSKPNVSFCMNIAERQSLCSGEDPVFFECKIVYLVAE